MMSVATIGWIFSLETRNPLKHPIKIPTASAARNPRSNGLANSVAALSPPDRMLQHTAALTAIMAPTEMSVPAEEDTTSVIPIARITSSEARLMISMMYPYRTPSLTEMAKKFGVVITFTSNTRARQKIGRNSRCDVIFFNVSFFILLTSCNG